jgi:hypothetical protein
MYKYTSLSNTPRSLGSQLPTGNRPIFGRVVKVLLDETDEEDYNLFNSLGVGGIRFRYLSNDQQELDEKNLPFAYRLDSNICRIPLKGEIVEIIEAPTEVLDKSSTLTKLYYRNAVNIWNSPSRNSYPDIYQSDKEEDWIEETVTDEFVVPPLYPFTGDIIVEGRTGQSIRMSGFRSPKNPFTTKENNGTPVTLIRNTSNFTSDMDFSTEDINVDDSSIYLTSDHVINLSPPYTSKKAYPTNELPPQDLDQFRGAQVLINSDRVALSSKLDGIFLNSINTVGVNGSSVNIEGQSYIGVESPKIFLGEQAINLPDDAKQPAVLGLENKNLMKEVINTFTEISNTFLTVPSDASGISLQLKVLGSVLQAQNVLLLTLLEKINSKKVFIDSGVQ